MCLVGAIFLGAILRLGFPGRMAIEHFDEGVYASNIWFGAEEGYEYPARHLYAPPLLPAAIEWTMIIASLCGVRPTGFIPMIPSLIAGLATIPSMWWIGRRWFGPSAGIVSAWLVAASDFHASYSRAALTDVPVCLFILWGIYFTWQSLQTGSRRDIALASLFTALAWWTKYNGWFPLAVGLAGGMAWQLALPRSERQFVEFGKRLLMVAGLSFLLWSPVLICLQKYGGYAAVAANHRQYVEGFAEWPANAGQQLDHIAFYDGPLRPAIEGWTVTTANQFKSYLPPSWIGWLPIIVLLLGTIATCLGSYQLQIRLPTSGANWALLAWICGLSVATPCYHPYPRLVLPWLLACWLGGGFIVQWAIYSCRVFALRPAPADQTWRPQWMEAAISFWLVAGTLVRCQLGTSYAWEDRASLVEGLQTFTAQISDATRTAGFPDDEAIVYVQGAPPVIFHLRAHNLPLATPVQDLAFVNSPSPRPTFKIDLKRHSNLLRSPGAFEAVGIFRFTPSSIVNLDQMQDSDRREAWTMRLDRLRN